MKNFKKYSLLILVLLGLVGNCAAKASLSNEEKQLVAIATKITKIKKSKNGLYQVVDPYTKKIDWYKTEQEAHAEALLLCCLYVIDKLESEDAK